MGLGLSRNIRSLKQKILSVIKKNFKPLYFFLIFFSGLIKFIYKKNKKKNYKKYSSSIDEINKYEFKKTSQNNEDGIIDYILRKIDLKNINFVEIGFDYYENNKFIKYMGDEMVVVREIKVSSRSVADSLVRLLDSGVNFALLAQQNSSTNPGDGGLYGPFSRRDSGSLFDAASLLGVGEYSPVLPTSKNSFSIIQLVEPASATPIDVDRVYVQIESLLIKEGQDEAKSVGIDGLLNKYTIIKNSDLLF